MSNRNRKATGGSTFADKQRKKAEAKVANLQEQVRAARMSLMNMRQMYEGVVQEKQALQQQLQQMTQIITGAAVQSRKNQLVLKKATFDKLAEFVGYEIEQDDGNLIITAVTQDDVEIEEDVEEGSDEND